MKVNLENVRPAVWAGIGYLDTHVVGWRKKIDLKKLNLASPIKCVLGEVYGDYQDGVDKLLDGDCEKAEALGFNIDEHSEMPRLTAEWRAAYKASQLAAKKRGCRV